MKYYKIVNPYGHHELVYHEGLNTDPLPFYPFGDCEPGGIYFAREDIIGFYRMGTELYEVEPVGEVYENPSYDGGPKKWKAHSVNLKYIGKVSDNIHFLLEQCSDSICDGDDVLCFAAECGHLNVVKDIINNGGNVNTNSFYPLRASVESGHLNVVKYLVEQGADIHIGSNLVLRRAVYNGHLDIVKYLVDMGVGIHACDEEALRNAAITGHLDVVKYLVEQGANIHALDDNALRYADSNGHTDIVKYLIKQGAKISEVKSKKMRIRCYIYRFLNIWI